MSSQFAFNEVIFLVNRTSRRVNTGLGQQSWYFDSPNATYSTKWPNSNLQWVTLRGIDSSERIFTFHLPFTFESEYFHKAAQLAEHYIVFIFLQPTWSTLRVKLFRCHNIWDYRKHNSTKWYHKIDESNQSMSTAFAYACAVNSLYHIAVPM